MTKKQFDFHPLADIFPLMKGVSFQELVADIKEHGLREPIWLYEGKILDGRNGFRACKAAGIEPRFTRYTGDNPLAFVISKNIKRRHLNPSQLAFVALEIERVEAESAKQRMLGGKKLDPVQKIAQGRACDKAAKAVGVNRQYISDAKKIRKADNRVETLVKDGNISLREAKRLIALPDDARPAALKALASGTLLNVVICDAKKFAYNKRIKATKPKPLEGTYRIILADPAWLYSPSLGGAASYKSGLIAEHHYDCLTDQQICDYRPGDGTRTVKELADKNAVLFLWVTTPMLERCFPIIKAWGFTYKTAFVWDKVKHNYGFYNSIRAEFLLVCTRGSCLPDTGKLIDSVQTIERTTHSKKPEEFYDIIESMYSYGRKLELFARKPRPGWDSDGNEIIHSRQPTHKLIAKNFCVMPSSPRQLAPLELIYRQYQQSLAGKLNNPQHALIH